MYNYLFCDCDGSFAASEVIAYRTLVEMLSAAFPEVDFTAASKAGFHSETPATLAGFERRFGITLPPGFAAHLATNVESALERLRAPIAAVRDVLGSLPLPAVAVSNQRWANLAAAVERAGLSGVFGTRLFSAEHVARPKPHPDLHRKAARQLGAKPAHCLAVVDNVAGLNAARSAGMTAIAFVGASHSPSGYAQVLRNLGVGHIIERMDDLPALVAGMRGELRPMQL
jgi:HAD superfamily hydrolase (TIGR01509 family)